MAKPHRSPCLIHLFPPKGSEIFSIFKFLYRSGCRCSQLFLRDFLNQPQIGKVITSMIKLNTFNKHGMIFPQLTQYRPNQFFKGPFHFDWTRSDYHAVFSQCGQGIKVLSNLGLSIVLSSKLILGILCPNNNSFKR